jgi:hypothetical protein
LKTPNPSFANVEAALEMSHWRPFHRNACHSVHAGPEALNHGVINEDEGELLLLIGASDAGIADPGQTTAMSLSLASVALLTPLPNLDSLAICKVMQQLCEDIGNAFHAADVDAKHQE